jgi:ligand-binding sensor protein
MRIAPTIVGKVREGLELQRKRESSRRGYGGEPALKTQKPRSARCRAGLFLFRLCERYYSSGSE